MKRNIKITCYSSVIVFCTVAAAYSALLLVPNKNYGFAVAIFLGLVSAIYCFFGMINLILEPRRDRKILCYILTLIINTENIAYFLLLLISRQDYHFIVGILFFLALAIYYLCRMIMLIREPAEKKNNEQDHTFLA